MCSHLRQPADEGEEKSISVPFEERPSWMCGRRRCDWPISRKYGLFQSFPEILTRGDFPLFESRRPGRYAEGRLWIVRSHDEWPKREKPVQTALQQLREDFKRLGFGLLGFDTEGVNMVNVNRDLDYKRPEVVRASLNQVQWSNMQDERPALLQLSTPLGTTVLVQLALFEQLPASLIELLGDIEIYKVGVAIHCDAHAMYSKWKALVASWIDLPTMMGHLLPENVPADVYNLLDEATLDTASLKTVARKFFGDHCVPFSDMKNEIEAERARRRTAYSFWAPVKLTRRQVQYASFDSQVAVDVAAVVLEASVKVAMVVASDSDELNSSSCADEIGRRQRRAEICRPQLEKVSCRRKETQSKQTSADCYNALLATYPNGWCLRQSPLDANILSADNDVFYWRQSQDLKKQRFVYWLSKRYQPLPLAASRFFTDNTDILLQPVAVEMGRLPRLLRKAAACLVRSENFMCQSNDRKLHNYPKGNVADCAIELAKLTVSMRDNISDEAKAAPFYFNEEALLLSTSSCWQFRHAGGVLAVHAPHTDDMKLFVEVEPLVRIERLGRIDPLDKPPKEVDSSRVVASDTLPDSLPADGEGVDKVLEWLATSTEPAEVPEEKEVEEQILEEAEGRCLSPASAGSSYSERSSQVVTSCLKTAELRKKVPFVERKDEIFGDLTQVEWFELKEENKDSACCGSGKTVCGDPDAVWWNDERTLSACWCCAEDRYRLLHWEVVVPDELTEHYLEAVECFCNYAKLCEPCVLLWRSNRYEMTLELALLFGFSIDTPANFVTAQAVQKLRLVLDRAEFAIQGSLSESSVSSDKKSQNKADDMLQLAQLLLKRSCDCVLKLWSNSDEDEPLPPSVMACAGKPAELLTRTEVLRLVPELRLLLPRISFSSRRKFEDAGVKVLRKLGWNVPLVEYMFRRRFRESMLRHPISNSLADWSDVHRCFSDRRCWAPTGEKKRQDSTSRGEQNEELEKDDVLPMYIRRREERERAKHRRRRDLENKRRQCRSFGRIRNLLKAEKITTSFLSAAVYSLEKQNRVNTTSSYWACEAIGSEDLLMMGHLQKRAESCDAWKKQVDDNAANRLLTSLPEPDRISVSSAATTAASQSLRRMKAILEEKSGQETRDAPTLSSSSSSNIGTAGGRLRQVKLRGGTAIQRFHSQRLRF